MTSAELIEELQGIKEISKRMSDVYVEKRANLSQDNVLEERDGQI